MGNLGYTFYPKDFISDPVVLMMTPEERGVYRDLIDLAMINDNKISFTLPQLSKYCNAETELIERILELKAEENDGIYSLPSCEKRIAIRDRNRTNGSKGGRPKRNPKETQSKTQTKPKTKGKEKEKLKEKVKENIHREFDHLKITVEDYQKLMDVYNIHEIDDVLDAIENSTSNKKYKSLYLTAKNWLKRRYPNRDKQDDFSKLTAEEKLTRAISASIDATGRK